jgi:hypothetical protein
VYLVARRDGVGQSHEPFTFEWFSSARPDSSAHFHVYSFHQAEPLNSG